ncbi:unnamed protein product [Bemisia tabaci]|uniref:Transporter n=2 Tax=Bemisia tabaci TaxID=7038 RepID=A0AAI8UTS0_BEMTA|nr:unnamed protein product [Bemisia tabaci]
MAQRVLENERVQEETRKLLLNGNNSKPGSQQQKIIIVPLDKEHHHHHHHHQHHRKRKSEKGAGSTGSSGSGSGTWKPSLDSLVVPRAASGAASLRSLRVPVSEEQHLVIPTSPSLASFAFGDSPNSNLLRPLSQVVSVRSLASIGMGSTDGKKMTIRKVPTSPSELLNIADPSMFLSEDEYSSSSSYSRSCSDSGMHYKPRPRKREHWATKLQFILACVGYSVGLGSLWRFPYLCYKSGGGVFLVPYFIMQLLCGVPLMYMELAIGQFTKRGPIGALSKLCPFFKGAGLSSVILSFFMSSYYSVIIAYSIYYFFTAFRSLPPWSHCGNKWNTPNCWSPDLMKLNNGSNPQPKFSQSPGEEFFNNKVLQLSSGIEAVGVLRWELVACLLAAWILVYFAVWKSVRSSGRVRYITATLPYLLIAIFFGYSLTLKGADLGLNYLFLPQWELLADAKVWIYAAAQTFNSIGIAFGSVISLASYNRYGNQIFRDTITVSVINTLASILVGAFAFVTIGNIAAEQNTSIDDVIADDPGLIFVVYPQALSKMPYSNFWAVLFFFTLLCIGLNSQFAIVEVVVTSVQDGFPNWIKRKLVCHEILALVVCTSSFAFGLIYVTQGGMYFLQLMDHFAASVTVLSIALIELVAVSWFYGANRLARDIVHMTGKRPGNFFTTCWWLVTPVFLLGVWTFSFLDYESPSYNNATYRYPFWAEYLGWLIAFIPLSCVPIIAIYTVIKMEGASWREKLANSFKPRLDPGSQMDYRDDHIHDNIKELSTLIECKIQPQIVIKSLPEEAEENEDNNSNKAKENIPIK